MGKDIEHIKWSFSRLGTFNQCPYQYKLQYEDKVEGISNSYGDYGTLMHDSIEMILRGEDGYSNYVSKMHSIPLPSFSKETAYHHHVPNFLKNFSKTKIKGEIIGIELDRTIEIDEFNSFRGLSDLELKSGDDYIIVDWKISKKFSKIDLTYKRRQLYLYAEFIKRDYGVYPKEMFFFFPADVSRAPYHKIKFSKADFDEAWDWFHSTIDSVRGGDRTPKPDWFYCSNLCSFRQVCEHKA